MENQELLEAIGKLMDEKVETMGKKMDEKLKAIKIQLEHIDDRLDRLELKQDIHTRKIDELNYQQTVMNHEMRKEFKKLNDEMETVITVLEGRNLMPKKIG